MPLGELRLGGTGWVHRPRSTFSGPLRDVSDFLGLGLLWGLRRPGARAREAIPHFSVVVRPGVIEAAHSSLRPGSFPGISSKGQVRSNPGIVTFDDLTESALRAHPECGGQRSPIEIGLPAVEPGPCRAGLAGR